MKTDFSHPGSLLLIEAMAAYVTSGAATPPLASAENSIGAANLRLVCVTLLSWLKARARQPKMVTMKKNEFGSAQADFISLIETENFFSEVIALDGEEIYLRRELTPVEVEAVISTAVRLYQPPRFVTRKRKDK